jgi:acetoin utilization deacetylase AcuC-like enzyme
LPKTAIYKHDDCLGHNPGQAHPESPQRLMDVLQALEGAFPKNGSEALWKEALMGTDAQVLYCHTPGHLARIKAAVEGLAPETTVKTDVDTSVSPGSMRAAMRGVGAVCQAVDDVYDGKITRAFCAVRPPGHHALRDASMGFCLFGNAAIAAYHALTKPGIKRVAILDFDVHHGNGTQDIVEHNPDILFFSIQQDPLWPYQDDAKAEARGVCDNIRNFQVPPKSDPQVYCDIFMQSILPEMAAFKPDFIILSAGFDAHRDDPPGETLFNDPPGRQMLTEADFDWMTAQLLQIAEDHAEGRFVSILEGGYNTKVLASCAVSHVKTLVET